ncbi:S-adenosylmethionine decarboxylase family protein [Thermoproteota archaeon]
MIGIHLMVDGLTANQLCPETIEHILTDLPPLIDMHILDGPHIIEGIPENPGYTGIEVIDKSHISIHTFSENKTISIDLFSCRPFDARKIVQYLKEHIKFKEINIRTIKREIIPKNNE